MNESSLTGFGKQVGGVGPKKGWSDFGEWVSKPAEGHIEPKTRNGQRKNPNTQNFRSVWLKKGGCPKALLNQWPEHIRKRMLCRRGIKVRACNI